MRVLRDAHGARPGDDQHARALAARETEERHPGVAPRVDREGQRRRQKLVEALRRRIRRLVVDGRIGESERGDAPGLDAEGGDAFLQVPDGLLDGDETVVQRPGPGGGDPAAFLARAQRRSGPAAVRTEKHGPAGRTGRTGPARVPKSGASRGHGGHCSERNAVHQEEIRPGSTTGDPGGRISVSGHPPQSLNFPREGFREGGAQADDGRGLFLEAAERSFDKARDSATSFSQSALNRA